MVGHSNFFRNSLEPPERAVVAAEHGVGSACNCSTNWQCSGAVERRARVFG
jgi:hypothetical protein